MIGAFLSMFGSMLTHLACFLAGIAVVIAGGFVLIEHERKVKEKAQCKCGCNTPGVKQKHKVS